MSLELIAFTLFGITVAERILELKVSQRNAAWSFAHGGIEYGAAHYRWMVTMHTGFMVAMVAEYLMYGSTLPGVVQASAIMIAGACQLMRWWIIDTLGPQWNTRVIVVPGAGRVNKGPYRFLKHPNYIVVATEIFTLPLIFGSWRTAIAFSALNAWMMWVRLRVENRALQKLVLTKAS